MSTVMSKYPSSEHLAGHQGDIDSYHEHVGQSAASRHNSIWWGVIAEYVELRDDSTVIDLGTGTGFLLELLREQQAKARLIGVEMQAKMLASAREIGERCNAEIIEADLAETLPLPNATADTITAVMVFHEMMYPPQLLKEAYRLLKPGGKFLLYDWVKRPLENYLQDMNNNLNPGSLQHFREHCLFSADDFSYMARLAGFEICEVVGRYSGNFALVVAKVPEDKLKTQTTVKFN